MGRALLLALSIALALSGCSALRSAHFHGTAIDQAAPNFTLTNESGVPWTLADQRGKVIALFFGFTHCADTCPDTLAKLSRAIASQGALARNAQVAFVTVDPERDTPAVLKRYLARFEGARIVGLTGTRAQIEGVEHAYHVWAQKIPGTRGGTDYDESHSAIVYLIDASGHERVVHDPDDKLDEIAADIRVLLQ